MPETAPIPQPGPETADFSEGERWVEELASGREVVFDGLPVTREGKSGGSSVSLESVSIKSLGPLPSQGEKALSRVVDSCLVSEESALTAPLPPPFERHTVQAEFAMRSAEAALAYVRFGIMKKILADHSYITVPDGAQIPCPSGFTRTVYSGFAMSDGKAVDVVFLLSHRQFPDLPSASQAYLIAKDAYIVAHLEQFNSCDSEGQRRLVAKSEEASRRLNDPSVSEDERQRLRAEVFPEEVVVQGSAMHRR